MSSTQLGLFRNIMTSLHSRLEDHLLDGDEIPEYNHNNKEPLIGLAFNKDAFEKSRDPSEETKRSLYIGNLTRALFVFYGGNLHLGAAYETDADWREEKKVGKRGDFERNSDGTIVTQQYRIREHYPENPLLSIAACRELATRIIDDDKYEEVMILYQKTSYNKNYRSKVDALCESYGYRTDTGGRMHEELFTFYLSRLPLFTLLKRESKREEEKQKEKKDAKILFLNESQLWHGRNNYCPTPSTNPKTALCALRRSTDFT